MRDVSTAPAMVIVKIITSLPDIVKQGVAAAEKTMKNLLAPSLNERKTQ